MSGATRDRAIGAFLGLACGDALGTTLEFSRRDSRPCVTEFIGGGPFKLKPGEWTDDTSMALCLADSILASRGFDPRDAMERFVRWWREGSNSVTGRCFDIGNTTRDALSRFLETGNPMSGPVGSRTAGNGSLMRLSPVAIAWWRTPEEATSIARDQSRLTHGAAEAVDACALFAGMLCAAISGAGKSETLGLARSGAYPTLNAAMGGRWHTAKRAQIKSSGYVIHTLEAALWAVNKTDTFRDAVIEAANLGDDADTVAAVTGQLAGAIHGATAIPEAWRSALAWQDVIAQRAAALYALFDGPAPK